MRWLFANKISRKAVIVTLWGGSYPSYEESIEMLVCQQVCADTVRCGAAVTDLIWPYFIPSMIEIARDIRELVRVLIDFKNCVFVTKIFDEMRTWNFILIVEFRWKKCNRILKTGLTCFCVGIFVATQGFFFCLLTWFTFKNQFSGLSFQ